MPKLAISMPAQPFSRKRNNTNMSLRYHGLSHQVEPNVQNRYYLIIFIFYYLFIIFFLYELLDVCSGLVHNIWFFYGFDFFHRV